MKINKIRCTFLNHFRTNKNVVRTLHISHDMNVWKKVRNKYEYCWQVALLSNETEVFLAILHWLHMHSTVQLYLERKNNLCTNLRTNHIISRENRMSFMFSFLFVKKCKKIKIIAILRIVSNYQSILKFNEGNFGL